MSHDFINGTSQLGCADGGVVTYAGASGLELRAASLQPVCMSYVNHCPPSPSQTCCLLLFLIVVPAVRAELIAADDFDYDIATIRGCDGGTGWADAWTGGNLISKGSLYFGDYDAKGNRLTTMGDKASGSDLVKCSFRKLAVDGMDHLIADGKYGRPGTTLWIAFVVNFPQGGHVRGAFGGVSLFNDRKEQLFLGDCGSTNVWAFERTGESQHLSSVQVDLGITFLVYQIEFQPDGARMGMWVNPKPGVNDPPVSETSVSVRVPPFQFNRVRVCSAPGPIDIDGLRLGTTYADVAPKVRRR